jgi:cell division protein FtsN
MAKTAAKPARAPQKKSGGGTLLGIFVGLVIGIVIAFGVVWYLNKSPLPFQTKGEAAPKTEKDKPATGAATTPAPLPGKPGDKSGDKQRFEFYGILEGKQQAKPGAADNASAAVPPVPPIPPAASPSPGATEAKPAANETFFLQAGAFQKAADADNLKAKLALSGLEAGVQEVSIPDKGTMFRVRIGPFRTLDELNRTRTQLSAVGVQASVIKQKE